MSDQRVIDAYLGAHHDAELTTEDEEAILAAAEAEIGTPRKEQPWVKAPQRTRYASEGGRGAVLRADDLCRVPPGVNISTEPTCTVRASSSGSPGRTAGKSTLLKACFGLVKVGGTAAGWTSHEPEGRRAGVGRHRFRASDQQRVSFDHRGNLRWAASNGPRASRSSLTSSPPVPHLADRPPACWVSPESGEQATDEHS